MRLLPWRRKALTGSPEVLDALRNRQLTTYPLLGGGARQRITGAFTKAQSAGLPWLYQSSPAARTVIDVIVRNIAQLDLRLYEEVDQASREPRPDHPAALSVRFPNEDDTSDHLIRLLMTDYLIYGNAYAVKFPLTAENAREQGQVLIKQVPAARVEVLSDSIFNVAGYRVHRDDGQFVEFESNRVIHWRNANPEDPTMGSSRLETLRSVIAQDVALERAIVELANSGMVSPSWVSRPLEAPAWSNEAARLFEEDLANRLRRSSEKPVVLEEGMELHDIGVSPRDAQVLEVRKYAIQQIAALYGVPLGMVGLTGDIEEARAQFYSDTLPPYTEEFTRWLNHGLLVAEYGETEFCFEFNLDEKHMGDDRIKALTSASGRPVLTTDEARARLNLPPIEGGDELVTPANVIVGDNPKPSTDLNPIQDPNKPSQDGDYREESATPELAAKSERRALRSPQNELQVVPSQSNLLEKQAEPRRRADLERQQRHIDRAHGVTTRFYNRVRNSLDNRKKDGKAPQIDQERWLLQLRNDLRDLMRDIVEMEGAVYAAKLAGEFDSRYVENYVKAMADGIAVAVVAKTAQDVDEDGFDAVKRFAERADVLAAAIGGRSTVFARQEAAKQAPFPDRRVKQWVANTERHRALDGETVPLEAEFSQGFEPGSAPNCRCTEVIF